MVVCGVVLCEGFMSGVISPTPSHDQSKVLSFESGPLIFKDFLCFLSMLLASFPAAFNLTELKKGFFPHEFNLPQHQSYVGQIPALEFFDPDGMSEKKKKELQEWHAEQVRRGTPYDFAKEMEDYCKSDVALLQAGCEAFTQEFERHTDFNPFAKCVTIACACNLYWRKHCLKEDTIAVEPLKGWRGTNVNQSVKALQWLYFKEQGLVKQDASPDRIKHVRNGGEQSVMTVADSYFVDSYDPQSNTVYEFHGCFWHGCPRCHPRNRHARHAANPDRTHRTHRKRGGSFGLTTQIILNETLLTRLSNWSARPNSMVSFLTSA